MAEDEEFVVFVESKNSNFRDARNKFNPLDKEKIISVARKYYDSLIYVRALLKKRTKKKIYIYLLESCHGDSTLRRSVRNRIKDRLPFKIQQNAELYETMIDYFDVLSLDEWNQRIKHIS